MRRVFKARSLNKENRYQSADHKQKERHQGKGFNQGVAFLAYERGCAGQTCRPLCVSSEIYQPSDRA